MIEIRTESIKLEFEKEEDSLISKMNLFERKLKEEFKLSETGEKKIFNWSYETIKNELIGKIHAESTKHYFQPQRHKDYYDDNSIIDFFTKTFANF